MRTLYEQLDIDKSISKNLPARLRRFFLSFVKDAKKLYGTNLASIIVFKDVISPEYTHGRSVINVIIVLNIISMNILNGSKRFIRKWKRARTEIVLITPEHIKASTDAFALEFFDIKTSHVCIFGQDFFDGVGINLKSLELQCEHELKMHFIELRQAYMDDKMPLGALLNYSLALFMPVLRGLAKLKGVDAHTKKEIIEAVCHHYNLSTNVFWDIFNINSREKVFTPGQSGLLFDAYLMQLERLINQIDVMEVSA